MVAVALSLGGCGLSQWISNGFKVGPQYARPDAAVADGWIDAAAPAVLAEPPIHHEWWAAFDDPTLDRLIRMAREQNLTLRQAGFRVLAARAQRAIAIGNLFPQTQQAVGQYGRIWESRNLAGPAPSERSFSEWAAGLTLSWELDMWGRFRRSVESADAALSASVAEYDDVLVSLVAEVATAYVDIRVFARRLEYARANAEIQRESLRLTQTRAEAGKIDAVGVRLSKSNLATTEASIPPLQAGLRQANNRLCTLLGRPPTDLADLLGGSTRIPAAPAEVAVGIPADLLRRRPDVRAAERRVAAQSAAIGVAVSDLYPGISIAGDIAVESEHFRKLYRSGSIAGSVGPSFRWNILNYGRLVNNVRAQEAGFNELVAAYQQTVLEANREVEDQLTAFLNAIRQVEYLTESVEQTRGALDLLLIQYREGEIDFSPVFILQGALTQVQDQQAAAEGSVAVSLIGLYKALGGGWQTPPVESPAPVEPAGDGHRHVRP